MGLIQIIAKLGPSWTKWIVRRFYKEKNIDKALLGELYMLVDHIWHQANRAYKAQKNRHTKMKFPNKSYLELLGLRNELRELLKNKKIYCYDKLYKELLIYGENAVTPLVNAINKYIGLCTREGEVVKIHDIQDGDVMKYLEIHLDKLEKRYTKLQKRIRKHYVGRK